MVNFKFFTLYAVMAIAFVVGLAAMTVQATPAGLSEVSLKLPGHSKG